MVSISLWKIRDFLESWPWPWEWRRGKKGSALHRSMEKIQIKCISCHSHCNLELFSFSQIWLFRMAFYGVLEKCINVKKMCNFTVWVFSWSVKGKLYKVVGVDLDRPHWYLGKHTVSSKSIISLFPICLPVRGKSASILFASFFSTFRQTLQGKLHPSAVNKKIKQLIYDPWKNHEDFDISILQPFGLASDSSKLRSK